MNKILYILLALFCIGVTACDNDDTVIELTSLSIVEATVDFDATGGEGFVTLGNSGNLEIKASSSEEWCTIKNVTGNKITFEVAINGGINSRSAMIKINEDKFVSITQIGVVSQYDTAIFYPYPDNVAFAKMINFTSTLPITVSIEDDAKSWLSYQETDGGYIFTASANNSGNARMGAVKFTSGDASIDYHFLQYGLEDLCGIWNASYSDGEDPKTDEISITETAEGLNINIKELGYSRIQAVYQDGSVKIPCAQFMGIAAQTYYIFLGGYDSSGQPVVDENATCQLTPYLTKDKKWGLIFTDNGSWPNGLTAMAFWAVVPSTGAIAGYWDIMHDLSLSK